MKKLNLIFILSLISTLLQAQSPQLNLPENAELASEAKKRFALSVDEMSIKDYSSAINAIQWLEQNSPMLYDGLYINGYKAYEGLAGQTDDSDQKVLYLDSMLYFFDKKEERFELTDREKNNRAYRYYKYFKSDKVRISAGMKAYALAYKNLSSVINNNIVSYMDMVRRYRAYGNSFTNEEVLNVYSQVMEAINIKEAAGLDAAKIEKYRSTVNGLLTQIIGDDLNCDFIDKNLAPPLDQGDDLTLAKKIFGLLLNQGCGDSPYYLKAALIIQEKEPTTGIAKAIAQKYYQENDMDNAAAFFMEAVQMEDDQSKKAELLIDLAKLNLAKNQKAAARKYALQAAELGGEQAKPAYSFIADLYMNSFNDCKKNISQIDDRAVFMAAFDMYQKAGNTKGMSNAKAQFPTVSDVFTANKKEGDSVQVGCWINTTTQIRTRPSE